MRGSSRVSCLSKDTNYDRIKSLFIVEGIGEESKDQMTTGKTALLSVFNKEGIVEFAQALILLGWRILSSGGTASKLREAGVGVMDVAEISGLSPILGHRVVTLVPQVHGGLLATTAMVDELKALGYPWIDLVCVDFYPLEEEIARPGATEASVIDKTDIGGPTMVSSGSKGRRIVIVDPADRVRVLKLLQEEGDVDASVRRELSAKADGIIAGYRLASARFHSDGAINGMIGTKVLACSYGENAWQTPAGLYSTGSHDPLGLDRFKLVAGKPPSYNNLCDLDRLLQTVTHMVAVGGDGATCALAVKHGNPCGAAMETSSEYVSERIGSRRRVVCRAIDGDRRAIFGGLVLVTYEMDEELADILLTHHMNAGTRRILDGVIAPSFTAGAIELLRRKGDRCRFLANPALATLDAGSLDRAKRFRYVRGGFLMQPNYTFVLPIDIVEPRDSLDLCLAWAVGAHANSNTVTLVKDGMLIGNGVGQQDRVGCCELAIKRAKDAGHDMQGCVAYSDSFFPFEDGPEVLIKAGVRAILATSGSIRDGNVRKVCKHAGVRFYTLPDAGARGFFGH